MNTIIERIAALRLWMKEQHIDTFIIPSNDPHFSEYIANHWKSRTWISGFTGSAGTVVVTAKNAALWTDSRYFLQADKQLNDTGIELKKLKMPGTESIKQWLQNQLAGGSKVGIDGKLFSVTEYKYLKKSLAPLELLITTDPFIDIWKDRPKLPNEKVYLLPDEITGKNRKDKLNNVIQAGKFNNSVYIVTALDEIAWLLNLRGNDVKFNPVAISYAVIDFPAVHLFIASDKLPDNDRTMLEKDGTHIHPYSMFDEFLHQTDKNKQVIVNPHKLDIHAYNILYNNGIQIKEETDANGVIASLKAIKNETEIEGFRKAMVADGVAMVRFLRWLEENVGINPVTEISAGEKLYEFRAQHPDFVDESFGVISAYKDHGALPHYSATGESNVELKPEGFYLVDSGGQYRYGTTDITRTIHLGTPTSHAKEDYTLVLKGMINLSRAKFPAGTRGTQLDILARIFLWNKGKNFLHGTGHGVGHFLNVHEGTQSIRMEENPVVLQPGMVTSNEPAVYIFKQYGIRTENLIACRKFEQTDFGDFYEFETLTLCPIETKPIDMLLLEKDEREWLNNYHEMVFDKLSPFLSEDEKNWLQEKTKAI
ncbi:MAG: aminopeptidase P family protein [Prevotellaceae bacterium]|jgi:Xaa-Pro aminopeptidase|nr:aminopeptidase P family protein [Prevotellaceae bacterium]